MKTIKSQPRLQRNQYETAAVEELLQKKAMKTEKSDVCIINTTVTHTITASRDSDCPVSPETPTPLWSSWAAMPGGTRRTPGANDVDLIIGTKDKDLLPQLLKERKKQADGAL